MYARIIFVLFLSASAPAMAQFPGTFPGGPQVGIIAAPVQVSLMPGRTQMVAAYCGSLLDPAPTHRDRYLPEPGAGTVTAYDGSRMDLRDAVDAGLMLVRGRGPADPPCPPGALWIPLYLVNRSSTPLWTQISAGSVFQPQGHPRPVPPMLQLMRAVGEAGAEGSDIACFAAWVATGSTRADLEHSLARLLSDHQIAAIHAALSLAGIRATLKDGHEEYASRFQEGLAGMGADPAVRRRGLRFPSGLGATVTVTRSADGRAVAEAQTESGRVLHYGAQVTQDDSASWRVILLNLKTGRPVTGLPEYALESPGPSQ